MSDELKNIPKNDEHKQEKMLDYLNGNMSDEAQHAFEKKLQDDEFMFDAVEGLEEMKDRKQLQSVVQQINDNFKKQLNKKKQQKDKRKITDQPWIYISLVLILILIIVAYLVIRKFQ